MKENTYQAKIIKRLEEEFPGCIVLKQDPNILQGVPDLIVLFKLKWAALEVKANRDKEVQPNQQHYIDRMGKMSFACFVYPENEDDVFAKLLFFFKDIKRSFRIRDIS